jgi:RNA polymerase sigma-70 factor, ECF subfamily
VSGQPDDFERVFTDCYEPVVRYVARRVAADAVQDVVSDTFLVAWRRRSERRGEPLPWLLGIARRVAATHRRGHARREALQQALGAGGLEGPGSVTRTVGSFAAHAR